MLLSYFNYFSIVFVLCSGIYIVCVNDDRIKRLFGMSVLQVAVLLFYISLGFIRGSRVPIIEDGYSLYNNPIPHVLMLTAIVVGLATLSVGLSIIIRINRFPSGSDEDLS